MDITKLDETHLKSLFYDELHKREQAQLNMNAIDQELIRRRQPQPEVKAEVVEDTDKPETDKKGNSS